MQRLKPFSAPAKYVFRDPDDGHSYAAHTKEQLFRQILGYREQNRLPPIDALDAVLENYWCSLPENCGACEPVPLKRGWIEYLKGGVALVEDIFFGEANIVDVGDAEARAKICVDCPENVFPDKGFFMIWADNIALAARGDRHTNQDDLLGNCAVCTCPLRAKIWHKQATFSTTEAEKAPEHCWILRGQRGADTKEP